MSQDLDFPLQPTNSGGICIFKSEKAKGVSTLTFQCGDAYILLVDLVSVKDLVKGGKKKAKWVPKCFLVTVIPSVLNILRF